jgi:hypothetical protein
MVCRVGRGVNSWVTTTDGGRPFTNQLAIKGIRATFVPDGANIPAIEQLAGLALSRGFHTVVEGIMATARYGEMLARLARQHAGPSYFYYLDIPFEETVRRHAGRPKATAFDPEEMRDWYRPRDLLTSPSETIIDESSTLDETVSRILTDSGLS